MDQRGRTPDQLADRALPEGFDLDQTTELPLLEEPLGEPARRRERRRGPIRWLRAHITAALRRGRDRLVRLARAVGRLVVRVVRSRVTWLVTGATAGGLLLGFGVRGLGPQLTVSGPADGATIGPLEARNLVFTVNATNAQLLSSAVLTLNDGDVTDVARTPDGSLRYAPTDLPDGRYVVKLTVDQPLVPWPERREWRFTLDRKLPEITITSGVEGNSRGRTVAIRGRVDEPARVFVDEREVPVADDGSFSVLLTAPPVKDLTVRAIDPAGNSATKPVPIGVVPRPPRKPVRAAHVTAVAWKSENIRNALFRRIESGVLTTVQLDLKDERGEIGYTSNVPLARAVGANRGHYDLADAVREIHARGGYVVGRLVAFRDPTLLSYSVRTGRKSLYVQHRDGTPYGATEGFTNIASPVVRGYNIDIAEEAARAGVDEILYDYVRRPDGPLRDMRFPGLRDSPSDEVIRFLASTQKRLEPYGTLLGASIFGIAAGRRGPEEIAQDVPRMSRYLDVVAPMLYPAGWGKGEYQVDNPEADPAAIVRRALRDFQEQTKGSGARLVPWLQDYTIRIPYGPNEVRLQIDAVRGLGVEEFMMWNPDVEYNFDGIPRVTDPVSPAALAVEEPGSPSSVPPPVIDDPLEPVLPSEEDAADTQTAP